METIDAILYDENIDIRYIISKFSSNELQALFGEFWHRELFDENINYTSDEEVRYFLNTIVNKKNDALILKLVNILLLKGNDMTALQIDLKYIDLVDLTRCDPRDGHVDQFSFGEGNPKDLIEERHNSGSMSYAYPMDKNPRGFCFLLNNYFTKGTYKEMQRFRNIFHHLNFDVIMRKNLKAFNIFKELLLLSKSDKLKNHNAFIFMSISHGNSNGEILGFDEKTVKIENLVELFNNVNCPAMQRKPRMFFFNCCRGLNRDYGVSESLSDDSLQINDTNSPKIATSKDLFICYSTLGGQVAPVDMNKGTPFGEALADSFVEKANYKDLSAIITMANIKLAEMDRQSQQNNQQNAKRQKKSHKQTIETVNRGTEGIVFFGNNVQ